MIRLDPDEQMYVYNLVRGSVFVSINRRGRRFMLAVYVRPFIEYHRSPEAKDQFCPD